MFLANSELSSSGVKFSARIVSLSNWNISRVGIVSFEDYLVNELTAFTWINLSKRWKCYRNPFPKWVTYIHIKSDRTWKGILDKNKNKI